jgi:hypothetical protein
MQWIVDIDRYRLKQVGEHRRFRDIEALLASWPAYLKDLIRSLTDETHPEIFFKRSEVQDEWCEAYDNHDFHENFEAHATEIAKGFVARAIMSADIPA